MKKIMLIVSIMSASLCCAGDFFPAQPVVPPRQIILIVMTVQALGAPVQRNEQRIIAVKKTQEKVVPKHQKFPKSRKLKNNKPGKGY